jgi:hypothetical protein
MIEAVLVVFTNPQPGREDLAAEERARARMGGRVLTDRGTELRTS